jgi:arylsulfatase A-like enzyme
VERTERDAKIDGMIDNYELAFRMQGVAPEILNLADESQDTLDRYGMGDQDLMRGGMPAKCLLARRLIEAGVRFIEIGAQGSDPHSNLKKGFGDASRRNDKPTAALLADLKERDLLKDTLIVCGGEFGRTPDTGDKNIDGRDHNHRGFTTWLAGGGVKGGIAHGTTDELGYAVVQDPVHIHDLHATILHLLGLDHERLTYRFGGRDFRLTNVYGNVVQDIIA